MFAIEFSPKQNSFHVQPLEEAIAKNFNSFFRKQGAINDYVILHLTDDQEDAFRICSLLMDKRDSWSKPDPLNAHFKHFVKKYIGESKP